MTTLTLEAGEVGNSFQPGVDRVAPDPTILGSVPGRLGEGPDTDVSGIKEFPLGVQMWRRVTFINANRRQLLWQFLPCGDGCMFFIDV